MPAVAQSALEEARAKSQAAEQLIASARELGVNCVILPKCAELVERAQKNPQLKDALLRARAADVGVLPDRWPLAGPACEVEAGYIAVNLAATDEQIIECLEK